MIKTGTLVIKPRGTIFEIANLKMVILPSIDKSLIFHNFKTFQF